MASVLFIILRLSGLIDTKFDWVILCLLISIDTVGVPNLISMMRNK